MLFCVYNIAFMTYNDFNNAILDLYVKRATCSFCNLSIDEYDVKSIIEELPKFEELKSNWNSLLGSIDDSPQYFGLIAIQCLAASQRQADDENDIGENEYQVRLRGLLDITNDTVLQQLYKGYDIQNPVQEQIWFAAKVFLLEKYDLEVNIPSKSNYAGRFVQYPKSQSLLTKEDLKRFTPFFSEIFRIDENISFDYFQEQCKGNFQNIPLRQSTKNRFTERETQCYEQVFNYFNHWNGTIFTFDERRNQVTKRQNSYGETSRLILYFENNEPFVHLDRKVIDWKNVFDIQGYKYFEGKLILFSQHEYYKSEYEDVRILEKDTEGYILINKDKKPNEYTFLNNNCIERTDFRNSIYLFKVEGNKINFGSNYKLNPAKLKGGIRVNRKREYLEDFAPIITCEEEFSVIFEHKKVTYNPQNTSVGTYKIRVNGYKDITFEIVLPKSFTKNITPSAKGWDLRTLSLQTENATLEGTILNLEKIETKQPIIRNWIDINLKKSKSKSKNHLLTAINRAKNDNFKD
jgi:hypothetical protein